MNDFRCWGEVVMAWRYCFVISMGRLLTVWKLAQGSQSNQVYSRHEVGIITSQLFTRIMLLLHISEIVVGQEGKRIHLVAQLQTQVSQIQLWTISNQRLVHHFRHMGKSWVVSKIGLWNGKICVTENYFIGFWYSGHSWEVV